MTSDEAFKTSVDGHLLDEGPDVPSDQPTSLTRGSSQLFIARIAGNAGFFVAVLILGRGLAPAERGAFALITTLAQVLAQTARLGTLDATIVFVARDPRRRAALLANVVIFSAVSTIVLSGLSLGAWLLIAGRLPSAFSHVQLLLLMAGAFVSSLAGVGDGFLVGRSRIGTTALVAAVLPWVYALALGIVWALPGLTVDGAMLVWIGVWTVWAIVLLARALIGVGLGRPSAALLREMVSFGSRAWLGSLTRFLNFRTDQILLGLIASQATLGFYAVAVNVSEILLVLPAVTAVALVPILARADPAERLERTLSAFRILTVIALVEILVAALLGQTLIPLIFGSNYHASVAPFLWLLPGTLGYVAMDIFASALLAQSAPMLSSLASVMTLIVGIVLDVILIPPFGASGAAAAASAAFSVGGVTGFLAFRRLHSFNVRQLAPTGADLALLRQLRARINPPDG